MSLIQQALEKAGRPHVLENVSSATDVQHRSESGRAGMIKGVLIAAGIFLISVVFIIYFVISAQAEHSSPKKDRGQALLSRVEARVPLLPDLVLRPEFTLTGITMSDGRPLALINDQVVAVGDRVEEKALVKEIQERRVILEFQGREIKLSL